jgi:hypothetical protein
MEVVVCLTQDEALVIRHGLSMFQTNIIEKYIEDGGVNDLLMKTMVTILEAQQAVYRGIEGKE